MFVAYFCFSGDPTAAGLTKQASAESLCTAMAPQPRHPWHPALKAAFSFASNYKFSFVVLQAELHSKGGVTSREVDGLPSTALGCGKELV